MKGRKRCFFIFLFFWLVSLFPLFSQEWQKESSLRYQNEILNMGCGARVYGLGGSFVGLADDATASYWNPAGLTQVGYFELYSTHSTLYGVGSFDTINLAAQVGEWGYFGFSFFLLHIPNIIYTREEYPIDLKYLTPWTKETLEKRSVSDFLYIFSLSDQLMENFSIGGSLKITYKDYMKLATAKGYSFDVGLLYAYKNLKLGMNFQDFWGELTWSYKPEYKEYHALQFHDYFKERKKEMNVKAGLSYTQPVPSLKTCFTGVFDYDTTAGDYHGPRWQTGLEATYKDTFTLRGGYVRMGKTKRWNFNLGAGFKVRYKKIVLLVDYAFVPEELSSLHRISLNLKIPTPVLTEEF